MRILIIEDDHPTSLKFLSNLTGLQRKFRFAGRAVARIM